MHHATNRLMKVRYTHTNITYTVSKQHDVTAPLTLHNWIKTTSSNVTNKKRQTTINVLQSRKKNTNTYGLTNKHKQSTACYSTITNTTKSESNHVPNHPQHKSMLSIILNTSTFITQHKQNYCYLNRQRKKQLIHHATNWLMKVRYTHTNITYTVSKEQEVTAP